MPTSELLRCRVPRGRWRGCERWPAVLAGMRILTINFCFDRNFRNKGDCHERIHHRHDSGAGAVRLVVLVLLADPLRQVTLALCESGEGTPFWSRAFLLLILATPLLTVLLLAPEHASASCGWIYAKS